ncbi:MAG: FecR family protein [Niabella sp.]
MKGHLMLNERLAILLSRKLSGEATLEEEKELQEWLLAHPGDEFFASLLQEYWNNNHQHSFVKEQADRHFKAILEIAEEEKNNIQEASVSVVPPVQPRRKLFVLQMAAAVLAIVLGIAIFYYFRNSTNPVIHANEVTATKGSKTRIELPDGTKVWINSDSRLTYNHDFNGKTREVVLDGEAFFDVVKDPNRPFIVHTNLIDIRVLGTAFNVKSYEQDENVETTLIRGLIEVSSKIKPSSPKIHLVANEKLVITKNEFTAPDVHSLGDEENKLSGFTVTALPSHISDSVLAETSWMYNRLIFDGESFKEVAVKMERWYNVKIHFTNAQVANYRLRGVFEKETAEEALKALQTIASFSYKINVNEIEISK